MRHTIAYALTTLAAQHSPKGDEQQMGIFQFSGRLFKNAQMQGAQKSRNEAYTSVCRLTRLAAQRSRRAFFNSLLFDPPDRTGRRIFQDDLHISQGLPHGIGPLPILGDPGGFSLLDQLLNLCFIKAPFGNLQLSGPGRNIRQGPFATGPGRSRYRAGRASPCQGQRGPPVSP